MSASASLEAFILYGVVPAVTIAVGMVQVGSYYKTAVSEYLDETERLFLTHLESQDGEPTGTIRAWSREFARAHGYRDAHTRSIKTAVAGAIGWVVSYMAALFGVGSVVFASPFGIPAELGIKALAVGAWIFAGYDAFRVANKFGVRPDEVASREAGAKVDAD
ncbi:hypothetical protein ACFQH6_20650 [Halobacteriaceae archaeon GCM10025711]